MSTQLRQLRTPEDFAAAHLRGPELTEFQTLEEKSKRLGLLAPWHKYMDVASLLDGRHAGTLFTVIRRCRSPLTTDGFETSLDMGMLRDDGLYQKQNGNYCVRAGRFATAVIVHGPGDIEVCHSQTVLSDTTITFGNRVFVGPNIMHPQDVGPEEEHETVIIGSLALEAWVHVPDSPPAEVRLATAEAMIGRLEGAN